MTPAAQIFEYLSHLGFNPALSSLLAGYAAVDWWGRLYLTEAGAAYLATRHG